MSEPSEDAARRKFIGYWPLGPIAILLVSPLLMVAHVHADAMMAEVRWNRSQIYMQEFMNHAFLAAPVVVVGAFFTGLCLVYKIAPRAWASTVWLRTGFLPCCVLLALPGVVLVVVATVLVAAGF